MFACILAALPVLLIGCRDPQCLVTLSPSLQPVDTARSYVRFSQIQGEARGRDAVLGAIRNLKRLDVDGYLEVVVEVTGSGDDRYARVTAYPFRYGTSTDTPVFRNENTDPVVVPGRGQEPYSVGFDCAPNGTGLPRW